MNEQQQQQVINQMRKYLETATTQIGHAIARKDSFGRSNALMLANDALRSCNEVQRRYFSILKTGKEITPLTFPKVKA